MHRRARLYVLACTVGAVHAVRSGRPCRFAGIRYPGTPAQHALTLGTPLSAPPIMLVAFLAAADHGRDDLVRMIAALSLVGIAAEVDTWSTVRHPTRDPISTACVTLLVLLPAAMLGYRERASGRRLPSTDEDLLDRWGPRRFRDRPPGERNR